MKYVQKQNLLKKGKINKLKNLRHKTIQVIYCQTTQLHNFGIKGG